MVRHYHIVAFGERTAGMLKNGFYLGKTSDLVFNVEPDKSIDLDDGNTEVGSEKLTLSFSILGLFNQPSAITEIWLIPICQDYVASNPDIVKIMLEDENYFREAKSGEFGKIQFSATMRYAVDNPMWEIISNYFIDYFLPLVVVHNVVGDEDIDVMDVGSNVLLSFSMSDLIVSGSFCLVYADRQEVIISFGSSIDISPSEAVGVLKVETSL